MKPGPATSTERNQTVGAEFFGKLVGEFSRLGPGVLGQHHRGIGRHVAMAGVARRLDHHAREIDAVGPLAFGRKLRADRMHARQHIGKKVSCSRFGHGRRLTQIRGRVKKPLVLHQGETVGHSGNEIADPARPFALTFPLRSLDPFGRQVAGRGLVAGEQIEQDSFPPRPSPASPARGGTSAARGTP